MVKKCLLLDDLVGLALVELILGGHDDHVDHDHVDGQPRDLGVGIDLNITFILPLEEPQLIEICLFLITKSLPMS